MVSRKTKSSSLKINLLIVAIAAVILSCGFFIRTLFDDTFPTDSTNVINESSQETTPPSAVDLQPIVNSWVMSSGGLAGIIIYDLDNSEIVAESNSKQIFSMASLYKLFVVYAGYLEVQNGELDPESKATSDYSVAKCLDLSIRESNSACAESLLSIIGIDKINNLLKDLAIEDTIITEYISTPQDILKIMQKYYEHDELSEENWAKIADSMLNQPPVYNGNCYGAYDWRQGLPSGFQIASVYNKVGWEYGVSEWDLYHDAAILEFPQTDSTSTRHLIAVVMTSGIDPSQISALGSAIEQAVLEADAK